MKPLRFAQSVIFGLGLFFGGFMAKSAVLSRFDSSPEKFHGLIADQNAEISQLKDSLATKQRDIEFSNEERSRLQVEINNLQLALAATQQGVALYSEQMEQERVEDKKLRDYFHNVVQYHVEPATLEEVLAIHMHFAAIKHDLSPQQFKALEKSNAYQKLNGVLSKIPHAGL